MQTEASTVVFDFTKAALKIVHLLKREEHQNRYIWKIAPNLDATSKTL
jgi:hypothetical protein